MTTLSTGNAIEHVNYPNSQYHNDFLEAVLIMWRIAHYASIKVLKAMIAIVSGHRIILHCASLPPAMWHCSLATLSDTRTKWFAWHYLVKADNPLAENIFDSSLCYRLVSILFYNTPLYILLTSLTAEQIRMGIHHCTLPTTMLFTKSLLGQKTLSNIFFTHSSTDNLWQIILLQCPTFNVPPSGVQCQNSGCVTWGVWWEDRSTCGSHVAVIAIVDLVLPHCSQVPHFAPW